MRPSSPRGWALGRSDPALAKKMLEDAKAAGHGGTPMFVGKSWWGNQSAEVTIDRSIDPGLPPLEADEARVHQVLFNLVDNAVRFTPPGGEVTIAAHRANGHVEITVADTGSGIPPEALPRLFERFYRVDDARSRDVGGTGLGLAIVKHLALANQGDVGVESHVGRGCRFWVTLPRA